MTARARKKAAEVKVKSLRAFAVLDYNNDIYPHRMFRTYGDAETFSNGHSKIIEVRITPLPRKARPR